MARVHNDPPDGAVGVAALVVRESLLRDAGARDGRRPHGEPVGRGSRWSGSRLGQQRGHQRGIRRVPTAERTYLVLSGERADAATLARYWRATDV